ncbi:MAG: hypothetical protein LBU47_03185, partial [Christensenellaceae bacterium]|nr:hypothetical protein [Christensenellaceae bacterium]
MSLETAVISVITLLLGGAISWLITARFNRIMKPRWFYELTPLFRGGVSEWSGLKTHYNGDEVQNLSSVLFAFWNDGKAPIREEDIAAKLCLSAKNGGHIYDAELLCATAEVIG